MFPSIGMIAYLCPFRVLMEFRDIDCSSLRLRDSTNPAKPMVMAPSRMVREAPDKIRGVLHLRWQLGRGVPSFDSPRQYYSATAVEEVSFHTCD